MNSARTTRLVLSAAVGITLAAIQPAVAQSNGPVRMARVSYLTGRASWRPDGTVGWSRAVVNLPMRQGAQVWLAPGCRMELQYDDGSTLRLGDDAVATLQTLYSDKDGEFTEVKLNAGTSTWHLKSKYSIFQVDTPCDSVKSVGPSDFRVDVRPTADSCAVRSGEATLTADNRDTPIPAEHYAVLHRPDDPVYVKRLGPEDPWDRFNDNRDVVLDERPVHVPENIGLVSGGLDRHGRWHLEAGYGWVWSPYVEVGWRPYHRGHWVWVDPFGWTWVSEDPWGWAPYHYGTWSRFESGWGWVPGPAVQYWSPARVDFVDEDGYITWAPLAPAEVVYPAFSVGFSSGNWAFNFSIGGCAVYEPFGSNYCGPVAYPAAWFGPSWHRHGWDPNDWSQNRFAANNYQFVPRNAAFGAVGVAAGSFGRSDHFDVVGRNATSLFRSRPQVVAARGAFSGPVNVQPTRTAFTPTHAIASNARPGALNRGLYRAQVPGRIAATSGSFGPQVRAGRNVATARGRIGGANPATSLRGTPSAGIRGARIPAGVTAARQSLGFRGKTGTIAGARGGLANAARARVGSPGRTPSVSRGNAARSIGNPSRGGGSAALRGRNNGMVAGRGNRGGAATAARSTNRGGVVQRGGGSPRGGTSALPRGRGGQIQRGGGGNPRGGGGQVQRGGGGGQPRGGGGQPRGGGGGQPRGGGGGQQRGGGGQDKRKGGG